MTFYQELQLNQAGSAQERRYHALVYLAKVAITMLFCFAFVSVFSILFGNENSVVGVVVLLCLMVFRNADFGLHTGQSTLLLALFFVDMAVFPHLAQQAAPLPALLLNVAALAFLVIFGCHNPFMFNQSTLVLGYLLLYGYDVSGDSYRLPWLSAHCFPVWCFTETIKAAPMKQESKGFCRHLIWPPPVQTGSFARLSACLWCFSLRSCAKCPVPCGQALRRCLPLCR